MTKDLQVSLPDDPTFGVLPFPRSYWVIPGTLLAGAYPGDENPGKAREKLDRLLDVGVTHVIDLTEICETNYDGVPLANYSFVLSCLAGTKGVPLVCSRQSIQDLSVPTVDTTKAILDEIDEAVGQGRTVYVHCWGGRGRCGTVVGCFLARHGLAVGDNALKMIAYLRRTDPKAGDPSPETEAQRAFVRDWPVGQ